MGKSKVVYTGTLFYCDQAVGAFHIEQNLPEGSGGYQKPTYDAFVCWFDGTVEDGLAFGNVGAAMAWVESQRISR